MSNFIRSSLTRSFTRLVQYINQIQPILTQADGGLELEQEQVRVLQRSRTLILSVIPTIEGKQQEWETLLLGMAEGEPKDQEQQRYDGYQANGVHFLEFLETVREKITQIGIILDEIGEENPVVGAAEGGGRRAAAAAPMVRLPKLELPEFHGDPLKWQPFWQQFKAAVDDQPIGAVTKLNYLISKLRGVASEAVNGYAVTEDNYPIVLNAIKLRFGDNKVVADALEAELINLPQAGDSVASLRTTAEAIERICRQFCQLGRDENSALFITTARSKLPRHVLTELVKEEHRWKLEAANVGKSWSMKEFRAALQAYIAIREEVSRCVSAVKAPAKTSETSTNRQGKRQAQSGQEARAFFTVAETKGSAKKSRPCLFCSGEHWTSNCPNVRSRNERTRKLIELQRCFRCLKKDHMAKDCPTQAKCRKCEGDHNQILCPSLWSNSAPTSGSGQKPKKQKGKKKKVKFEQQNSDSQQLDQTSTTFVAFGEEETTNNDEVFLMTKLVNALPSDEGLPPIKVLVLLDPCSTTSFVRLDVVKQLGALRVSGGGCLKVYPFAGEEPVRIPNRKYEVKLRCADNSVEEITAHAIKKFGRELTSVNLEGSVVVGRTAEPDILVGLKDFWRFFISKTPISKDTFLIKTTLGDVFCGKIEVDHWVSGTPQFGVATVNMVSVDNHDPMPLVNQIEEFWALETIGIRDNPQENEDEEAMEIFRKSIQQKDGRYFVSWPWRYLHPDLPSNYEMAYSRLRSVLKRLQTEPELAKSYDSIIKEQLKEGIIEVATRREGELEHFLSHHPVITHKLRIVYDASAHTKDTKSLNQLLYRGPVILPELVGLLMRFRVPKFPVLSDIAKAFLQIGLKEPDREVAKFLWVKDPCKPLTSENLIIFRFCRVAFGVISSPFLLAATLQHHLSKYTSGVARQMMGDMYVDNLLLRAESLEEALEKSNEARSILADAQMNLREFVCNAPGFAKAFPPELLLGKEVPKVLGIPWDLGDDRLKFVFPKEPVAKVTRRTVLQSYASVFDPLGLCSPCILKAKLFFQTLWVEEKTWDMSAKEDEIKVWKEIENEYLGREIEVCRRTTFAADAKYSLHGFVDASKEAYACAIYLRTEHRNKVTSSLVFARSRIRPKSASITIPRMELLAMLIGVRAMALAKEELQLPIEYQNLWGDSKIVLSWLNSKEHQPKFVSNRLAEIRKHGKIRFGYVNTTENPADVATRGATPSELQTHNLWWAGPEWLCRPGTEWPKEMEVSIEPFIQESMTVATFATQTLASPSLNFGTYGSWTRSLRVMAYIYRVIDRKNKKTRVDFSLEADEIERAEFALFRLAQQELGDCITKRKLQVFEDQNGVIRLNTRISNSAAEPDTKNPVLLPRVSEITRQLIIFSHFIAQHAGVDGTLSEFLLRFWTPDARRLVRIAIQRCRACKMIKGPAYPLPAMPNLPVDRVTRKWPFESVGIDYLGPTLVKGPEGREKVWILLITCLTTRAVYIEPAWSLSGKNFLQIFRRFVARRGRPKRVLSDNGTQFRLCARVIRDCAPPLSKIGWKFIGQLSPWQGGVYERLVALVKRAFKCSLGKRLLNHEELLTFTAEVEASLNRRPLTFVSTEEDGMQALRPIDFLCPFSEPHLDGEFSQEHKDITARELVRVWKGTLEVLEHFWKKFNKEYLLLLREKAGWFHKGKRSQHSGEPKVGEIVLVEEPFTARNLWPLGRIVGLEERSGAIRNAQVKLASGKIYNRPLSRLYPLEVGTPVGDNLEDDAIEGKEGSMSDSGLAAENAIPEPVPEKQPGPDPKKLMERENGIKSPRSNKKQKIERPSRTHAMVTRGMAKLAMIVALYSFLISPSLTQMCLLECNNNCIHSNISGFVQNALLCCDGEPCKTLKSNSSHPLSFCPERGEKIKCDLACEVNDETTPNFSIECHSPKDKGKMLLYILILGGIFVIFLLCLVSFLIAEKVRAMWPSINRGSLQVTGLFRNFRRNADDRAGNHSRRVETIEENPPQPSTSLPIYTIPRRNHGGNTQGGLAKLESPNQRRTEVRGPMISVFRMPITLVALILVSMLAEAEQDTGQMECTMTGVQGYLGAKVIKAELCCESNGCLLIEKNQSTWVQNLPNEILVEGYECHLDVVGHNHTDKTLSVSCPPVDECRLIDCFLCPELLANPKCYPFWTSTIYAIVLSTALLILCCVISIFRQFGGNCWWVFCGFFLFLRFTISIIIKGISIWGKRPKKSTHFGTVTEKPSGNSPIKGRFSTAGKGLNNLLYSQRQALIAIIGILIYQETVAGQIMTANTEECIVEDGRRVCIWNHVSSITLLPAGQPVVLLLRDPDQKVQGSLTITVEALTVSCLPETEQWLFSYKVSTQTYKRCPGMGQCQGSFCQQLQMNEKVEGLEACQKYPGTVHCNDHCSGWWCGCAMPLVAEQYFKACIFHCRYAEPVGAGTPFKVFSCPSWETNVKAKIQLEMGSINQTVFADLHPGMTFNMGNLSVTPISLSQTQAPIFNRKFISDEKSVALADPVHLDLFCGSKEEAEARNCTLAISACAHCEPDNKTPAVHCQCRDLNLEEIIEDGRYRLPLELPKLSLRATGDSVFAESNYAPIQLLIKINGLRLATETENLKCHISPKELRGCYSCMSGAKFFFNCKPSGNKTVLAEVECDNGVLFAHKCEPAGVLSSTPLAFNHSSVKTNCKVICSGGTTTFSLEGNLNFVKNRRNQFSRAKGLENSGNDDGSFFDFTWFQKIDLWSIFSFFLDWKILAFVTFIIFIILIFFFTLCKLNAASVIFKLLVRIFITHLITELTVNWCVANQLSPNLARNEQRSEAFHFLGECWGFNMNQATVLFKHGEVRQEAHCFCHSSSEIDVQQSAFFHFLPFWFCSSSSNFISNSNKLKTFRKKLIFLKKLLFCFLTRNCLYFNSPTQIEPGLDGDSLARISTPGKLKIMPRITLIEFIRGDNESPGYLEAFFRDQVNRDAVWGHINILLEEEKICIETTHLPEKRVFEAGYDGPFGFSAKSAKDLAIYSPLKHIQITVEQYFRNEHNLRLKRPGLPCLMVGGGLTDNYPLEVLTVELAHDSWRDTYKNHAARWGFRTGPLPIVIWEAPSFSDPPEGLESLEMTFRQPDIVDRESISVRAGDSEPPPPYEEIGARGERGLAEAVSDFIREVANRATANLTRNMRNNSCLGLLGVICLLGCIFGGFSMVASETINFQMTSWTTNELEAALDALLVQTNEEGRKLWRQKIAECPTPTVEKLNNELQEQKILLNEEAPEAQRVNQLADLLNEVQLNTVSDKIGKIKLKIGANKPMGIAPRHSMTVLDELLPDESKAAKRRASSLPPHSPRGDKKLRMAPENSSGEEPLAEKSKAVNPNQLQGPPPGFPPKGTAQVLGTGGPFVPPPPPLEVQQIQYPTQTWYAPMGCGQVMTAPWGWQPTWVPGFGQQIQLGGKAQGQQGPFGQQRGKGRRNRPGKKQRQRERQAGGQGRDGRRDGPGSSAGPSAERDLLGAVRALQSVLEKFGGAGAGESWRNGNQKHH